MYVLFMTITPNNYLSATFSLLLTNTEYDFVCFIFAKKREINIYVNLT
jgi:hypothetical protein